jgi:hypothetical protein
MYLCGYVGVLNIVLQVTHKHEISGLEPAVVQRVVVDLTQDGACTQAVRAVLGVDVLAQLVHLLLRRGFLITTFKYFVGKNIIRSHKENNIRSNKENNCLGYKPTCSKDVRVKAKLYQNN